MAKRSIKKFIAFTRGSVTGLERRIQMFIIKLKFTTVDQGNDRRWTELVSQLISTLGYQTNPSKVGGLRPVLFTLQGQQCEIFYVLQAKLRDEAYDFSSIYYKTITSYYLKIKSFRFWDEDDYEYEISYSRVSQIHFGGKTWCRSGVNHREIRSFSAPILII